MSARDEEIRSQRKAHALLGKLIERCDREGLPVLHWAIAEHGLLTARCVDTNPAARSAAFRAWVGALHLGLWPKTTRDDGRIRLQAVREDIEGVDVSLIANVRPEDLS